MAEPNVDALSACRGGQPSQGFETLQHAGLYPGDSQTPGAAWLTIAECHAAAGDSSAQEAALAQGQLKSISEGDSALQIRYLQEIASLNRSAGDISGALSAIDAGINKASVADRNPALPGLHLMKGNILSQAGLFEEAIAEYATAAEAARSQGNDSTVADAGLNRARAMLRLQRSSEALAILEATNESLELMPVTDDRAREYLVLGELYHRHDEQLASFANTRNALTALTRANDLARKTGAGRTQSGAVGFMGAVAQRTGQGDQALAYTRAAIELASQAGALDLLYRWQWQSARILASTGNRDAAIQSYTQAIDTLEMIRPALAQSMSGNFNAEIAPLYSEAASLLLEKHAATSGTTDQQDILRQVRDTLEQFKVAEIQDYFGNECVIGDDTQTEVDSLANDVAVIYPVVLAERLEVLASFAGQIHRHTVPVSRRELSRTANDFRRGLVRRPTHRYRAPGEKLYTWLLGPVVNDLRQAGVKTLVFVADGALRTIPPAALYDGDRFLIEEFAVASSLGLSLTSPAPLQDTELTVIAGGLTQSVAGFSALPAVEQELAMISRLYGATELRDSDFDVVSVEQALAAGNYSIVHLATHGQFKADYRDSFLLAYDGKMTMNALESAVGMRRFLNEPVELLMLSACETAVGDDRAALGLAGVALKAGARSAIATLWSINDQASAELVGNFYQVLDEGQVSKAETLRRAQLSLIEGQDYSHPFYWSPYLLIGNWL